MSCVLTGFVLGIVEHAFPLVKPASQSVVMALPAKWMPCMHCSPALQSMPGESPVMVDAGLASVVSGVLQTASKRFLYYF